MPTQLLAAAAASQYRTHCGWGCRGRRRRRGHWGGALGVEGIDCGAARGRRAEERIGQEVVEAVAADAARSDCGAAGRAALLAHVHSAVAGLGPAGGLQSGPWPGGREFRQDLASPLGLSCVRWWAGSAGLMKICMEETPGSKQMHSADSSTLQRPHLRPRQVGRATSSADHSIVCRRVEVGWERRASQIGACRMPLLPRRNPHPRVGHCSSHADASRGAGGPSGGCQHPFPGSTLTGPESRVDSLKGAVCRVDALQHQPCAVAAEAGGAVATHYDRHRDCGGRGGGGPGTAGIVRRPVGTH